MELTKLANAKLNLSLDLTCRLPNGYHFINTVMQSVTLCDTVTVAVNGPGIRLTCDADVGPAEKNTAYLAAAAFYAALGKEPAADITVQKRIPSQAGLGGGSADAAAVLRILNELYGFPLREQTLLDIALKIGADVPFALTGGTRLCLNIGEITSPLPPVQAHVALAKPAKGVSTAAAYRKFDDGAPLSHPANDLILYHFAAGDHKAALESACNVFEQLTDIPEGKRIKAAMQSAGAYYTALSGSGSAYFGLFDTAEGALRAERLLAEIVPFTAVCETPPAVTKKKNE